MSARVRCSTSAIAPLLRRARRLPDVSASSVGATAAYHYKGLADDNQFGEKSWDVHPALERLASIDVEAVDAALEREDVQRTHFGESNNRFYVTMKAAFAASHVEREKLNAAAAAQDDSLSAAEIADIKADLQFQRNQERDRIMASRSYASYAEFAAKELPAASEQEQELEERGDNRDERAADDDDGDDDSSKSSDAAGSSATFDVDPSIGVPRSLRADAPRDAYDFRVIDAAAAAAATPTPIEDRAFAAVKQITMVENADAPRDDDDPLHWSTDDVIAWLKHFAPTAMDPSMEDAFRMVRVNGDMLLNRVAVPVLFKEMRRWHVKQRKGVLYTPVVTEQMVQEAVYMCYPYCRF